MNEDGSGRETVAQAEVHGDLGQESTGHIRACFSNCKSQPITGL